MNDPTVRAELTRLPLLAGADANQIDRVAGWSRARRFAAGELMLQRGEPADELHVVVDGRVSLSIHAPGRGDLVLETLGRHDVVGVSWAVPPYRWGLDARAVHEVSALTIDGVRLRAVTEGDDPLGPVVLRGVVGLLGDRLHAARHRLVDLYDSERRS